MQGLFEYYMATLDMKNCRELPVPVLIYFQYDNRLQLKQKAFLFRYVIEHEQWLGKLFEAYDGIIKAFTFEQLQKGVINVSSLSDEGSDDAACCEGDAGDYF